MIELVGVMMMTVGEGKLCFYIFIFRFLKKSLMYFHTPYSESPIFPRMLRE